MIEIKKIETFVSRAFGWVQDPSNFLSLCAVVAVFKTDSITHKDLLDNRIKKLISKKDGQNRLLAALKAQPLKIKYSDLIGTAFYPRSKSRCNGIVQATVKGQKRDFIGDWPADNFVRWAHALNLIRYDYFSDSFYISGRGIELANARSDRKDEKLSGKEIEILINAVIAYPPACRILELLSQGEHLTKYDIGKKLGFIGEDGFISMPQNILLQTLAQTDDVRQRNKIRNNWESSSDKYARMIASWLQSLGLVEQKAKIFLIINKEVSIGHAYIITAKGLSQYRKILGISSSKKISKNLCWEMFATKGNDRDYIRTRRACIIKILNNSKQNIAIQNIQSKLLNDYQIQAACDTIEDDIKGFINIGISIQINRKGYYLKDTINSFIIPIIDTASAPSEFLQEKEKIRSLLTVLPHHYLSLLDLAFDSKQNRQFEAAAMDLLIDECGFKGALLGGSRKPDGVIYTDCLSKDYGVIIDTKAYSQGYNLPISQADEMSRYIRENAQRKTEINKNEWWLNFPKDLLEFYFMFISGKFIGNIEQKLKRIVASTNTQGNAAAVKDLLVFANDFKEKKVSLKDFASKYLNV
ncbi:MAG: hypothetical protein LBT79_07275 [Elusimicrobiota bacterium]|nr:hypothetical protein [Elusimicrobiota bacterium]